jgi:glycine/D-amino acid oxidase-like deaminating enzyme
MTDQGLEIEANIIILANGYEMPAFFPSTQHRLASTWALATVPQLPSHLWPERALVWEASEPYNYVRTASDNRIIIGGEDADEKERDAKIPAKIAALLEKVADFAPGAVPRVDASWAGFFGQTEDGLPLIGKIPSAPNCYVAFGYGGNGITFSALAADLIADLIKGKHDPLCDFFSITR